jgi:hypothetical protein
MDEICCSKDSIPKQTRIAFLQRAIPHADSIDESSNAATRCIRFSIIATTFAEAEREQSSRSIHPLNGQKFRSAKSRRRA